MYDIALSVLACVRADTAVHVAWIASDEDMTQAVAITPGGGRMGSLLQGALDHAIVEALPGLGDRGGLVRLTIGPAEAMASGLDEGTELTVAIAPGDSLSAEFWQTLSDRRPISFAFDLEGSRFAGFEILEEAGEPAALTEDRLVYALSPTSRVVISGGGPIADALAHAFALAGWQPSAFAEVREAEGVMATLSPRDAVVVMGHDVEVSGRALQAAVGSKAGYIASIGSTKMQELRERWLSYRGVAWDERIHGPAGLPIGASNPGEIAISIVAEAIASNQRDDTVGR